MHSDNELLGWGSEYMFSIHGGSSQKVTTNRNCKSVSMSQMCNDVLCKYSWGRCQFLPYTWTLGFGDVVLGFGDVGVWWRCAGLFLLLDSISASSSSTNCTLSGKKIAAGHMRPSYWTQWPLKAIISITDVWFEKGFIQAPPPPPHHPVTFHPDQFHQFPN